MQLEGIFDMPPTLQSALEWHVDLPIDDFDWNIGLIVGPSGSGKTTIANELFPDAILQNVTWPDSAAVIDAFPDSMSIKDITALLSSVGFSSPPAWLRPYRLLSTGEQFRVRMARALAEMPALCVVDEFTSVVDRTVAKIGSTAIAKTVRKRQQRFIAVTCHYDVADWLEPDWIYEPQSGTFRRDCLQRPEIILTVRRVDTLAWELFRHHHYLDTSLNKAAHCYVGFVENTPATFISVLGFPHPHRPGWRLHRLVVLPDFQGVGLGVSFSDYVSGLYAATGRPVFRTAGHPAVVWHCAKSPNWNMHRGPSRTGVGSRRTAKSRTLSKFVAKNRLTAGFEYTGVPRSEDAIAFGLNVGTHVHV